MAGFGMRRHVAVFKAQTPPRTPNAPLAKSSKPSLFQAPQRVFEITPLVPGSPSLDVRLHSPGGTRRSNCRFKIVDFRLLRGSPRVFLVSNRKSAIGNLKLIYANPLRSF